MGANLPTDFVDLVKRLGAKVRDMQGQLALVTARRGTVVLSAGAATVALPSVTAATHIHLTIQAPGGTVGAVYVFSRTAGTSFTIHSTSGTDTSTVAWSAVEPQ